MVIADCESCSCSRYCPKRAEYSRLAFFSFAKGERLECKDYEPRWFRGIEGVAA